MKKKCYLCGPMSGLHKHNFPAFYRAEEKLKNMGYEVFNPARNGTKTYRTCLKKDLNWILDNAEVIAIMPGWRKSKGATTERALAKALKLEIINV